MVQTRAQSVLGKRKDPPEEDDQGVNDTVRTPPPRKKVKIALKDGKLSNRSSKRVGKAVKSRTTIKSPVSLQSILGRLPGTPLGPPTPEPRVPSAAIQPVKSPPLQNVCGHTIHPAYAAKYTKSNCPSCLMDAAMTAMRNPQNIITAHGGASQWLEEVQRNDTSDTAGQQWSILMKGGHRGGKPAFRDKQGRDISYRHHKRLLLNLVTELEALSAAEQKWEQDQPAKKLDNGNEHVRTRRQYSATSALHRYHDAVDHGFIGRVEQDCATFSRKRGRDWEVSTDPDYPDSDSLDTVGRFTITRAQRKFIDSSAVPQVPDVDPPPTSRDERPKRKRRRMNANVRFNHAVYVCSVTDVDVLKDAAKVPVPSSLRPATDMNPKQPYHVVPLKHGRSRRSGRFKRHGTYYQPGPYAPPSGSLFVDTSGNKKDLHDLFMAARQLKDEAATMDDDEAAVLKLELADHMMTELVDMFTKQRD